MEFTPIQATRLAGCSISQVRYWDRIGLVRPSAGRPGAKRYRFRDLVSLRMVCALLDAGLSLQRIRKAVEFLQQEAAGEQADDAPGLAGLRLISDGSTVFACRTDGEVLDALRGGQLALFVSVEAVAGEVEAEVQAFSHERDAFVEDLRDTSSGES